MIMYSKGNWGRYWVAEKAPELIFYELIDPLAGIMPNQLKKLPSI